MIEILWHGRGGQGAFTAARLLGAAYAINGNYALAFPSFGPERRGAPIRAFTKLDDKPIGNRSETEKADFSIFLDDTLFSDTAFNELKPEGIILLNTKKHFDDSRIFTIDANTISENHILVETVDIHTGEVLKPGEVGELVFTTLRKHARPLIRFRTGDIGRIDNTPCKCGRTHGRIHINGRKDDMFIVSAVNVFPSDIEAVIREQKDITGEYLIRIFEKDFTCKYSVEIEKKADNPDADEEVAAKVSAVLKARIGVKPYTVVVHPDGELDTRSEHKSRRIIDERKLDYSI